MKADYKSQVDVLTGVRLKVLDALTPSPSRGGLGWGWV